MLIPMLHRRGIRLPRWVFVALATLSALALAAGSLLAQPKGAYGFVYLVNGDTLGLERVTSRPGSLTGDIVMRGQPRVQWMASIGADGLATSITITAFRNAAADAPLLQRATLQLDGDTVRAEMSNAGAAPVRQNLATKRGALMLVNASMAMTDLILARARALPGAVDSITVFGTTGGQTFPSILRITGDSAQLQMGPSAASLRLDAAGFMTELDIPAQRLRAVRVEGAAYASLTLGAPDYSAPANAPYTAEHVKIQATGGHQLAGTLTMPKQRSGPAAVVVTISGSGPQDRDEYIPLAPGYRPFRQFADSLGRRGIAVLRYDDRGTGESTGDHATATSEDFANDTRSAVRWLRARADIDPDKVMLMGHSEGGMIAPMVAATDPSIAGIVLLAGPGEKGEPILRFQLRNQVLRDSTLSATRRDSALKAVDTTIDGLKKQNPWMRFFLAHDPLVVARRVKVPTYIVQGATDLQVTADQAPMLERALKEGGNRDVTTLVLKDHNHLFLPDADGNPANYVKLPSGKLGPQVLGPVVDWVFVRANSRKGIVP